MASGAPGSQTPPPSPPPTRDSDLRSRPAQALRLDHGSASRLGAHGSLCPRPIALHPTRVPHRAAALPIAPQGCPARAGVRGRLTPTGAGLRVRGLHALQGAPAPRPRAQRGAEERARRGLGVSVCGTSEASSCAEARPGRREQSLLLPWLTRGQGSLVFELALFTAWKAKAFRLSWGWFHPTHELLH